MDLRGAEVGARSTLGASRDGALFREYHDTGEWHVVEPRVDEHGGVYVDLRRPEHAHLKRPADIAIVDVFGNNN